MTVLLVLVQAEGIVAALGGCPGTDPATDACCCCRSERPADGIALTATGCCRTEVRPTPLADAALVAEQSNPTPRPISASATVPAPPLPTTRPVAPPPFPRGVSRAHAPPCYLLYCARLD